MPLGNSFLNKLRRRDHCDHLRYAAKARVRKDFAFARTCIERARFDRECFARNGWRLP